MSEAEREATRALLPGLHYLAVEALRSGNPAASQAIYAAISTIENIMEETGDTDEQRDSAQEFGNRAGQPH